MKLLLAFLLCSGSLLAQDLNYYLPDSVQYNPKVPKPKEIIGHEVGEWHVTHDRLVNYMQAVAAAAPERVKLQWTGRTYESRPQLVLIITSPRNHQNLEQIRQQHLQLSDPAVSASLDLRNMPAVVWMGYSIHGNESSGSNASLLAAYHLAAAQGAAVDDLLANTVILIDPSFNPDGLNRFATWANMHKSKNLISDPNSREFNEVWPGGRFNHYWFDLNRDWLPAVHVESQNRLKVYHQWKPNILTDHHEMGSNSTFFFQPGVPSRVNPLTPGRNQELTAAIGRFHASYLDRIGSLYYTKEGYDDFYYGKGSTYPDINGAVGILFEQASSRGHAQQTRNGLLTFPFTIRNQFVTTLSTLEAARTLRQDLLSYQREFYRSVASEAASATTKAYVFGDSTDRIKSALFAQMLRRHQIEVYRPGQGITSGDMRFNTTDSYLVPSAQPQHRLIKSIFEKTLEYKDSLFYDVTAWTMPLAFGLKYAGLRAPQFNSSTTGQRIDSIVMPSGMVVGSPAAYAYLLEWNELLAPKALYQLQQAGVTARVSTNPFVLQMGDREKRFDYGTISIPVSLQNIDPVKLRTIIDSIASENGIIIHAVGTGNALTGSDLGSNKSVALRKPVVMMLTGSGVSATDAGEIWHLMDQRLNIPLSLVDISTFNRADINDYTTIVMVSGSYSDLNKDKLKAWVQSGGNLLLMEEAVSWGSQNGYTKVKFKTLSKQDSTKAAAYADREFRDGAQRMSGAIFRAQVDTTHPLGYGYRDAYVYLFKSNAVFPEKNPNPYSNPLVYNDQPLESGFVTQRNYEGIKQSAAVLANTLGSGRVISIADNPNFRAFWLGGTRLFMNAIFFGSIIDAASARNGE